MGEIGGFFVNAAMGMENAMRLIYIIKWRQKEVNVQFFSKKEREAKIFLLKYTYLLTMLGKQSK